MSSRVGAVIILAAAQLVCCGGAIERPARPEPHATAPKHAPGDIFVVRQLSEVMTAEGPCYAVAFEYEIPAADDVIISGVGVAPPSGAMSFITCDTDVRIDDMANQPLAVLDLTGATKFMGDDIITLPRPADFGDAVQTATWHRSGNETFGARALAILQEEFDFVAPSQHGTECRVVTAYKQSEEHELARVAIMLGYAGNALDPVDFRIWIKVQERRSRTEWRNAERDEARQAAVSLVARVRKQLAGTR